MVKFFHRHGSCQLGVYPNWRFLQCLCAITLFFCAHWQTYVSGTLRFGKVDVTEAQITIVMVHLVSMVFGPDIWLSKIWVEICEHLEIQLFRIPQPPKPPLTVSQGTNAPSVDVNAMGAHDKNGTHGHQHRKQSKSSKQQPHIH